MTDLIAGPYAVPDCRPGDWLDCEIAGRVEVGGWTNGPIAWPRRRKRGRHSLIVCGDLIRAIKIESVEAIAHHFGVGVVTVWSWRKALDVGRINPGTHRLLCDRTGVPPDAAARGRAKAASPESMAKMAASRQGQKVPPQTRAALVEAAQRAKPAGWGKRANQWMSKAKGNQS